MRDGVNRLRERRATANSRKNGYYPSKFKLHVSAGFISQEFNGGFIDMLIR
jgi:hypothetical protein